VKRFWREVAVGPAEDGWAVRLDDRAVRTPARHLLVVPNRALADAIAEEWQAVDGEIDPRAMRLTGLANAAIDGVAPEKDAFSGGLARYGEADLACYRSDRPPGLVERQSAGWDPLLAWARRRYDVDFSITYGVIHVPQPPATIDRLAHAVAELDAFGLAGLSPLVTVGGSLIAALAVLERAMTADAAWQAVSLDDRWQLEQWGSDREAEQALDHRRRDFFAAASFLELLDA
jgi:chaperone required for assembly of F1-ATPase